MTSARSFRILSLDGGGARGIFTLGALEEMRAVLGKPIHQSFDLIYGTSTGAIIASLISLGYEPQEITGLYLRWIPSIFSKKTAGGRSAALRACGAEVLGGKTFEDCLVPLGITTTDCDNERPKIFKSSVEHSFTRRDTFRPGFGASMLDAVMASSAAVPYFKKVQVETVNQGTPVLIDGGFVANNPTLFAITDALGALKRSQEDIGVISIGVGRYVEPRPNILWRAARSVAPIEAFEKMLTANSNSTDWLVSNVFPEVEKVRIDKDHPDKRFEFSILSADVHALQRALTLGRDAFAEKQAQVAKLLDVREEEAA